MQIELTKPKLQKFIDEQVQAGHFPSAQAAVETAVEQMMLDHGVLDDPTIAAILNADVQYERGNLWNGGPFGTTFARNIQGPDAHGAELSRPPESASRSAILKKSTPRVRDSPQNASRMIGRILDAIDLLEIFPHRTVVERQASGLKYPVRTLPAKPDVIYFRVIDEKPSSLSGTSATERVSGPGILISGYCRTIFAAVS